MKKLKSRISKAIKFMEVDLWKIKRESLSQKNGFFIRALRILIIAIKGYDKNKCSIRASALTFFSLLSVVPVLALAFGIANGFGLRETLQDQLRQYFAGQQEVLRWSLQFADSMLENTKGGVIAGIGVVILFYTIMQLLHNIEESFNAIWQIHKPRIFARKFTDYITMMVIAPILIILSSSMNLFITTQVTNLGDQIRIIGLLGPFILFLLNFLPYVFMWLLLTMIYMIMPNTKVNFVSALIAGIVAGTIYQLVQWGYINFQVGVARYGAIYGSFAFLPLFLIWLQLAWMIVLFGAEISFAVQTEDTFESEKQMCEPKPADKKLFSLLITQLLVKNFISGEKALNARSISTTIGIPYLLARKLLDDLVDARIVAETRSDDDQGVAYQPAQDTSRLTVQYVLNQLDNCGECNIEVAETNEIKTMRESLHSLEESVLLSNGNVLLREM